MNNKVIFIGAAIAALAVAGLYSRAAVTQTTLPEGSIFPYQNQKIVQQGQQIYTENCASCHGDDLQGEPDWQTRKDTDRMPAPPHDETGHTWHHSDELLFAITKLGLARMTNNPDYQTDMPIYDGILTDDEIIAALAYIKAQWPEVIQERHDQLNSRPK